MISNLKWPVLRAVVIAINIYTLADYPGWKLGLTYQATLIICSLAFGGVYGWLRFCGEKETHFSWKWTTPFWHMHKHPMAFWALMGFSMFAGGLSALIVGYATDSVTWVFVLTFILTGLAVLSAVKLASVGQVRKQAP
jgi:hypothetical protein